MRRKLKMIAVTVFWAIFASLVIGGAVVAQTLEMNSDWFEYVLYFVLGLPVSLLVGAMGMMTTSHAINSGVLKGWPSWAPWGCFAGLILVASGSFAILHWWRIPSNIKFDFGYGQSDSWQIVNFHFKEGGRWLDGPSIERWPMVVSFPDLNGDGYRDIRVEENGDPNKVVDYIYLPKNDGKCFWHLVRNTSDLYTYYDPEDWPKYRAKP